MLDFKDMTEKELTLDEYQQMALETAIYPLPIIYPTLGLTGEAGEVSEKIKKVLRDNEGVFDKEKKREIAKEIGDVLWHCATLSNDIGYTLSDIAKINYEKIHSRQVRGNCTETATTDRKASLPNVVREAFLFYGYDCSCYFPHCYSGK